LWRTIRVTVQRWQENGRYREIKSRPPSPCQRHSRVSRYSLASQSGDENMDFCEDFSIRLRQDIHLSSGCIRSISVARRQRPIRTRLDTVRDLLIAKRSSFVDLNSYPATTPISFPNIYQPEGAQSEEYGGESIGRIQNSSNMD
jgi:hypothetical protein